MGREENKWFVLVGLMVSFILALVGFSTPGWYKVTFNAATSNDSLIAGFFDACLSNSCRRYLDYFNLTQYSDDIIGCIVFNVFGVFFLGLALLVNFCAVCRCNDECGGDCRGCQTDRGRFLYVAWFTLFGGLLLVSTVVWFYISQIRNQDGIRSILSNTTSVVAHYSLGLVAAGGGLAVLLSIVVFLMRLRMYDEYYDDDEYYERRVVKRAPPPRYVPEPRVIKTVPVHEPPPYVVAPRSYRYKSEPTYLEYGSRRYNSYPEKKRYLEY